MMNSQGVLLAWQQLLPKGVAISAGPPLENPVPLTDTERLSVGNVGMERARELRNGRTYAKRALTLLDIRDVDIPVAADHSPVWPEGVVGSITHTASDSDGHFAAAVARTQDVIAVGIDVEHENGVHPRLWRYFLTKKEFRRILAFPAQVRLVEAQVIWCAKEALIKALRQRVEPTALEIEANASNDSFAVVRQLHGFGLQETEVWHVRTVRTHGLIFAVAARL
jgi:4'-phosphopantetheinyl transferase EntD